MDAPDGVVDGAWVVVQKAALTSAKEAQRTLARAGISSSLLPPEGGCKGGG